VLIKEGDCGCWTAAAEGPLGLGAPIAVVSSVTVFLLFSKDVIIKIDSIEFLNYQ
jgi:hypothetical protein